MNAIEQNYFTCSLGQAAALKEQDPKFAHSFKTVFGLIDEQAERVPKAPAVGFADFKSEAAASARMSKVSCSFPFPS